jgi:catechol 2,3-dioxygenase-like lactoylglutathione lyase family enzyme
MISSIDHVVILVKDLEAAKADYTGLGFTVVTGGEHTGGATHNALIAFADGTYIELIAFKREAAEHRWWPYAATGEGLIDFAVLPTAIADDIAAARQCGLELQGPEAGGRVKPDGTEIRWENGSALTHDLPFLCADVTPRNLRVPSQTQHPNNVTGIARLGVAVQDIEDSAARYQALLGVAPDVAQGNTAVFSLGKSIIRLAESSFDQAVATHLSLRGEGPYELVLYTGGPQAGALDPVATHGVMLELVIPAS